MFAPSKHFQLSLMFINEESHLKSSTQVEVFNLTQKCLTTLKRFARNKQSSLFGHLFSNEEEKIIKNIDTFVQCYQTFYGLNLLIFVISLCLYLESLYSLVLCLLVSSGAYPRVERLKGASLGGAPAFPAKLD